MIPVCKEQDLPDEEDSGSEEEFDPAKLPEPDWQPSYLVRTSESLTAPTPGQLSPKEIKKPSERDSGAWCGPSGERQPRPLCGPSGDAKKEPTSPTTSSLCPTKPDSS